MKCRECNYDYSKLPEGISEEKIKFCPFCGKNFRYECPICHKTTITIIGIDDQKDNKIRCPECKSLFYVCEKCGRLEEPKQIYCQECGERGGVLVSYDLSSDTYNGTGFCDNATIKLSPNQEDTIETTEKNIEIEDCHELHSAKILGGYLFVWHDSIIEIFDINSNFKKSDKIHICNNPEKANISPCMALLGDNIIIATKEKFLWYTLSGNRLTIVENDVKGQPIALISGHHGVAMWTEEAQDDIQEDNKVNTQNKIHLYTAMCPKTNSSPNIKEIDLDEEQELSKKSPYLAMTKTKLYWQGESKNIYEYDFLKNSDKPEEIPFEHGEIFKIWTDDFDRVSVAVKNDSYSGNNTIIENIKSKEDEQTRYNLTNNGNFYIYTSPESPKTEYVYIIKNESIQFNDKDEYKVPNGKHIYSVLCKDQNNKLILISIFKHIEGGGENKFFSLFTKGSNTSDVDYICEKIKNIEEPIKLLCYKDKIFILHKNGIVVLDRNNSKDTKKETD